MASLAENLDTAQMYVAIHLKFAQVLKECQLLSTPTVLVRATLVLVGGRGQLRQRASHAVLATSRKQLISGWSCSP